MRWFVGLTTTAAIAAVVLGVLTTSGRPRQTAGGWTVPDITLAGLETAFGLAPQWAVQPNGQVGAGIVPHHGLVSPIMAAWFSALGDQPAPGTIVLIGPDHHNAGAGYITTAITDWRTPDGAVQIDQRVVADLVGSGNAILDPQLIRYEHGVYTVIPFAHRVWPKAKIVTLAIKGDLRSDHLDRLANELDLLLGENDLVLATVDFSHYVTAIDALKNDQVSLEVIARGDVEGALRIPVDSPPAISLVLRYAKLRQLTYQQLVHTTSAQFTGQLDAQSTTSYLSAYFVR